MPLKAAKTPVKSGWVSPILNRESFFPRVENFCSLQELVDRGHERSSYRCVEKGKHA